MIKRVLVLLVGLALAKAAAAFVIDQLDLGKEPRKAPERIVIERSALSRFGG